jgi:hypothetical protein
LFAALNVGTGEVTGRHYKRRRRVEFLNFMNRMVKQYQGKEIHVVLDNLSTHKPKRDLWLARHPNVHFRPYVATATSVDTADRLDDVPGMFPSSSRFP